MRIGVGLSIPELATRGGRFSPASLFTGGTVGAWYDPSDVLLNWRTNLLTYSQEFDNAAWTKVFLGVTANAASAPDSTTTADKITPNAGGVTPYLHQTYTTAAAAYTVSFYAKADGYNFVQISDGVSVTDYCNFNLSTGAVGNSVGYTGSIQDAGSGWYRCIITKTFTAASTELRIEPLSTDVASRRPSFVADGTSAILLWGAQLELGSTATAYQAITTPEQTYLLYDPQPVLYQDSAGTTPVTAVEQPVGLMLDKSQGLVLGPELITNGGPFTTTTGWTAGSNAVLSATGGRLRVTNNVTDYGQAGISFTTVANTWYAVTFNGFVGTSGFFRLTVGSSIGSPGILGENFSADTGTITRYFLATGTTTWVTAQCNTTNDTAYVELGSMSVKSIAGNHASQSTSTSRPVLRARYNLLTYSEQFDNAAWSAYNATASANVAVAPDGTTTADKIVEASGVAIQSRYATITNPGNTTFTASIYAKAAERNFLNLSYSGAGSANWFAATFDLVNGTITKTGAGASGTYTSSSITAVGNGWYRCVITGLPNQAGNHYLYIGPSDSGTPTYGSYGALLYAGSASNGVLVWGADLRTGSSAGTYQRIAAATDYATAGFAPYFAPDGTDDFLGAAYVQSAYPLTIAAGVNNDTTATGGIGIVSVSQSDAQYKVLRDISTGGTDASDRNASNFNTSTITVSGNKFALAQFETSLMTHQVNGGTAVTAANTNAFGTSVNIFVGKTRPSGLFSTARIYGVVVTNTVLTAAQKDSLKNWMAGKMGVTL